MDKKYYIVLFSNRKKRRVLFKTNVIQNAQKKYKEFLKKEKPLFHQVFRNKVKVRYEIALVTNLSMEYPELFSKDEFGRSTKAEFTSGEFSFIELDNFYMEEKIYDYSSESFIYFDELYKKVVRGQEFKQVFTLNTKLFLQKDETVIGFSLKNIEDCQRLFTVLRRECINNGFGNIMFVQDFSTAQRKDLYGLLQKNGFPKESLYKHYSY